MSEQTYVSDRSETDKLGIYSHYHSRAYHLIAQATYNPNGASGSEYGERMMKTLARKAFDNYQGMYQEEPSFAGVNFYQDVDFNRSQDRLARVKYDLFHLEAATSVLEYFLENDLRLTGDNVNVASDDEVAVSRAKENSLSPVEGEENQEDSTFANLKDFQVYTRENVHYCINGLKLCERIIGAEIDELKPRTANNLKDHMPQYFRDFFKNYAKVCLKPIETKETTSPAHINVGLREKFKQNFTMVERSQGNPDNPKRSLKGNDNKPS